MIRATDDAQLDTAARQHRERDCWGQPRLRARSRLSPTVAKAQAARSTVAKHRQRAVRTARSGTKPPRYTAIASMLSGESAWEMASMLAPITAALLPARDCTIDRCSVASGIERV